MITSPCGPAVVANRIVVTPTVPLVSPALYTVVLNPTGTAMPGVNTGLSLPRTRRADQLTVPQGIVPRISQQPEDITVRPWDDSAVFSAAVLGYPQPTQQWQVSTDGGGAWQDLPAKLGPTLVVRPEDAVDGNRYRVKFSNQFGTVTSRVAKLAVGEAPVVTLHPADRTNESLVTSFFSFTAAADGIPAPSVQWEESLDGGQTWADVPDATSNDAQPHRRRHRRRALSRPVRQQRRHRALQPSRGLRRPALPGAADRDHATAGPGRLPVRPGHLRGRGRGRPCADLQWQWAHPGSDEFVDIPDRPHRPSRSRVSRARRAPGSAWPSATTPDASTRLATLTLAPRPVPPRRLDSGPRRRHGRGRRGRALLGGRGRARPLRSSSGRPAPTAERAGPRSDADRADVRHRCGHPGTDGLQVRAIALNAGGPVVGRPRCSASSPNRSDAEAAADHRGRRHRDPTARWSTSRPRRPTTIRPLLR